MKTHSIFLTISFACFIFLFSAALFAAAPGSQARPYAVQFKDQDGGLITDQVRVLCFSGAAAVSPFADLVIAVTAGLPDDPLPAACSHLAALRLRHSQPAGKRAGFAYQVYATSWQPGETQPAPATGDVVLSDLRPLTLFHLVASLGWTPAPNSVVTSAADISAAARELSAVLYDWTEGQMAIGPVSVYTGGDHWAEADLRFTPANDQRPSAFVGGIVSDTLVYSGHLTNTTYTPAATYYGRLWDGRDAFVEGSGRWTEPAAYRTIAHEWAHYALFLYDEYQNSAGLSGYCICNDLAASGCRTTVPDASAMAYHYQTAEFWHKDTHLTVASFCYDTWQFHVHGQPDWDTLGRWHIIQGLPLSFAPLNLPVPQLTAGPELGLAAHLFGREAGYRHFLPLVAGGVTAVAPPAEPLVNLLLDSPATSSISLPSQVYLLKGNPAQPQRILPQGRATGSPSGSAIGQIRLLDVAPGDAVRAYVDWPDAGQRYTVYANENPGSDIVVQANAWAYTLEHRFTLADNRVTGLTLWLQDDDSRLAAPVAQICSLDTAVGCHPGWQTTMARHGGWWQAQFAPLPGQRELPRYLVARIVDGEDTAVDKEIVQWLQVAGGVGPTHNDGMAPLLDAQVMVNTATPLANSGDCNVVSYMPAANRAALVAPLPTGIGGLIGIPLDISITLFANQCPLFVPGQRISLPVPVLLNMGYSQDEVDRLGLNEPMQLEILRYVPQSGWVIWQKVSLNSDLNWLTTTTFNDGIYAIGWRS
ncbi:MAG: hypothetical protein IPM39_29305 [Chloroflexi bacterium]|nr:hypothetical protein [Chloroflexota bacterium]